MKKSIIYILLACLLSCPASASYTYEVYTYSPSKNLKSNESILIDQQGGMSDLILEVQSSATIKGTSVLVEGSGGIWQIDIVNDSSLYMSSGQVNMITIGNGDATAILSGGTITGIFSNQLAWKLAGDPPQLVPNPHIEVICRGWDYDTLTKKLTGIWDVDNNKDGLYDTFNIQLVNVQGYSPAIENIKFTIIPEPITLLLLGLGGLLLRRK